MPKIQKRGRPSKDTQSQDPNYCVIKDPLMEPYFIQKDRWNYTIIEKVTPTRGFAGKKAIGKEIERPIAYLSSFKSALWRISQLKFKSTKGEFNSIKEYINEWDNVKKGIDSLLNKLPE